MKCDICSSETDRKSGFILTSTEVTSSLRYWQNQLPKFKHAIASIDDPQAKADFIVEKVAQYALDPSGWLVCEPCSQLFEFNRALARESALNGQDRPDVGPGDLEMSVSTAKPVIKELTAVPTATHVPPKTKRHWQCPRCGALYVKDDDSRQLNEMLLRFGATLSGGVTCADCRTRHDIADVYSGKYDMTEEDDVVAAAIADAANTHMDEKTNTWYHNGRALAGPRRLSVARKPWWRFWL